MLRESGRVETVEDGFAWVVCTSQVDCKRCAEGRGCGGGLFGRLLGDRLHRVRAANQLQQLGAGDRVELSIPELALVTAAAAAYGLPLLGFLGAALAASWVFGISSDFALLVIGLAGLALGVVLARRLARQGVTEGRYAPVITRRLAGQCGVVKGMANGVAKGSSETSAKGQQNCS